MGSSCTLGTLGNFQLGLFNTIRDGHVWDGRGSTVLKNLKDFSGKWGTTGPKIGYVKSCHVISYHVRLFFHFMSSHVISCQMSFHVTSCHFTSVHVSSFRFILGVHISSSRTAHGDSGPSSGVLPNLSLNVTH